MAIALGTPLGTSTVITFETYGDYGTTSASNTWYKDHLYNCTTTGSFSAKELAIQMKRIITTKSDDFGWYKYPTTATCNDYYGIKQWFNLENATTSWINYSDVYGSHAQKSPQEQLREIIQNRHAPNICGRKYLKPPQDPKEIRARETLLRVLGEDKFRVFLRNGFVSVRAKSGMVYQIFPDHGITCVYKNGQMMERLCVVLRGGFPPTDSLIMRYLLILNDEQDFRSHAVKHSVIQKDKACVATNQKSLPEIYRELTGKRLVA